MFDKNLRLYVTYMVITWSLKEALADAKMAPLAGRRLIMALAAYFLIKVFIGDIMHMGFTRHRLLQRFVAGKHE